MKIKSSKLFKIIVLFMCFSMLFEQSGFAQVAGELDISGQIMAFRNSLVQDQFRPLHLRYLQYNSQLNNFKLLLDKGNLKVLSNSFVEQSTKTLLQYFLIGVSLPNDTFWVNLRPDAEDNIIDPFLAQTDIGKILLETDVQLKKDTARLTSPETPEGKEYWNKLYRKAAEIYGSENVTIPTLTRPWIVPNEIIIREANDNAYIYKATLKVMLEEDYLKGSAAYSFSDERQKELNTYAAQVLRERIIPKLTQEVNTSKRYAALRQVYYSLILAQWFKQRFINQSSIYSNLIDRRNLTGLRSEAAWLKTTYFNQYQKSFKDGEYNFKVPIATPQGKVIRSYFSGGVAFQNLLVSSTADVIQGTVTFTGVPVVATLNTHLSNLVVVQGSNSVGGELVHVMAQAAGINKDKINQEEQAKAEEIFVSIEKKQKEALIHPEKYPHNPNPYNQYIAPASDPGVFAAEFDKLIDRQDIESKKRIFTTVIDKCGLLAWFDIFWSAYVNKRFDWHVRDVKNLARKMAIGDISTERIISTMAYMDILEYLDFQRKDIPLDEEKDIIEAAKLVNTWVDTGVKIDQDYNKFIEHLKILHAIAAKSLCGVNAGVMRSFDVKHTDRMKGFLFGKELEQAMRIFAMEVRGNNFQKLHPVLQAAKVYFTLTDLQYFANGNRRVAKLLMDYYLMRAHLSPLKITEENKQEFIKVTRFMKSPEELADFVVDQIFIKIQKPRINTTLAAKEGGIGEDTAQAASFTDQIVIKIPGDLLTTIADLRSKPLDPRAVIFNKVSNQEDRERVNINLSNLFSNEDLVSVADFGLAWQRDPKDKKQTPFLLRQSVAADLQKLDKELRKIGLHLVIRDGFRTISEQRNNIKEGITNTIRSKVSRLADDELLKIAGFAFEQDMLLRVARPKALNNLVKENVRQQAIAPLLDSAINQFLVDNNINDPARIAAIKKGIIETLADSYYRYSNPERTMPHLSGGAFDVEIRSLSTNKPIPTKAWVIFGNQKETEIPQEEKELYQLASTKGYRELEEYFLQYPTGPPQEYTKRQQEIYGQLKILLENRRLYYWIFNLDSNHGGILNSAQTFVGLPGEHWHFGRGDRTSAIVADTQAYYDAVVTEEDAEFFSVTRSAGKIEDKVPQNEIEKMIASNKLLVEDIVGLAGQDVYAVEFFDGSSSNAKNLLEIKTAINAKRAALGIGDRIILFGRFIGLGRLEKAFQEKMQARDIIRRSRQQSKQDLKNEPIRDQELDKIHSLVKRSPAFTSRIAEDPLGSVRNIHRWNMYFKSGNGSEVIVHNVVFADIEKLAKAYDLLDSNLVYNEIVDYIVPAYGQGKNAKDAKARIVFRDGSAVDNLEYRNIETVIQNKISASVQNNRGYYGQGIKVRHPDSNNSEQNVAELMKKYFDFVLLDDLVKKNGISAHRFQIYGTTINVEITNDLNAELVTMSLAGSIVVINMNKLIKILKRLGIQGNVVVMQAFLIHELAEAVARQNSVMSEENKYVDPHAEGMMAEAYFLQYLESIGVKNVNQARVALSRLWADRDAQKGGAWGSSGTGYDGNAKGKKDILNQGMEKNEDMGNQQRIILDSGIDRSILNSGRGFRVTSEGVELGNWWAGNKTTIYTIDSAFEGILKGSLIAQFKDLARQKQLKGEKLYILDWGAGNLAAAKGLVVELEKAGVNNFQIIAYADVYVASTGEIPDTITLIIGTAENLAQNLKKVLGNQKLDAIYSFTGMRYLYGNKNGNIDRFKRHINELSVTLSSNAFIVYNGFARNVNYLNSAEAELGFKKDLKDNFKNIIILTAGQEKQNYIFLKGIKTSALLSSSSIQMDNEKAPVKALDNQSAEELAREINKVLGGEVFGRKFPGGEVKVIGQTYAVEVDNSKDVSSTRYSRVMRIGALIFVVLNYNNSKVSVVELAAEIKALKEKLKSSKLYQKYTGNVVFTTPTYYQARSDSPISNYTVPVIATMLANSESFHDAVVFDFGAGDGLLARLALRLGARRVVLVENEQRSIERAKFFMEEDGLGEEVQSLQRLVIIPRSLTENGGQLLELLKAQEIEGLPTVALINIGPHYDTDTEKPNSSAVGLAVKLNTGLVINGGHFKSLDQGEDEDGREFDYRNQEDIRDEEAATLAEKELRSNDFSVSTVSPYAAVDVTLVANRSLVKPEIKQKTTNALAIGQDSQEQDLLEKTGGINFRALPILTQLMVSNQIITGDTLLRRVFPVGQLDKEWQQIENMLNAGIIPSVERIKGYIEVSCTTNDCQERMNKVLSGVADMLRLGEARSAPTEISLKQILNLLESGKSANELQLAIAKIEVLAKEPVLIGQ